MQENTGFLKYYSANIFRKFSVGKARINDGDRRGDAVSGFLGDSQEQRLPEQY
jgi:hypothetical protein